MTNENNAYEVIVEGYIRDDIRDRLLRRRTSLVGGAPPREVLPDGNFIFAELPY